MRGNLSKTTFVGGLLTAILVCPPVIATEVVTGLPDNFLEYLGSLVDQDGEWVDALELNDGELLEFDGDIRGQEKSENDELARSSNGSTPVDGKVEE